MNNKISIPNTKKLPIYLVVSDIFLNTHNSPSVASRVIYEISINYKNKSGLFLCVNLAESHTFSKWRVGLLCIYHICNLKNLKLCI